MRDANFGELWDWGVAGLKRHGTWQRGSPLNLSRRAFVEVKGAHCCHCPLTELPQSWGEAPISPHPLLGLSSSPNADGSVAACLSPALCLLKGKWLVARLVPSPPSALHRVGPPANPHVGALAVPSAVLSLTALPSGITWLDPGLNLNLGNLVQGQ